jgi:hypothetical protein
MNKDTGIWNQYKKEQLLEGEIKKINIQIIGTIKSPYAPFNKNNIKKYIDCSNQKQGGKEILPRPVKTYFPVEA